MKLEMNNLENSQAIEVIERANLVYSDGNSLIFLNDEDYKSVVSSTSLFRELTFLLDKSRNYIIYPSNSPLQKVLVKEDKKDYAAVS